MAHNMKQRNHLLFAQNRNDNESHDDLFEHALTQILGEKHSQEPNEDLMLRVRIFNTAIDAEGRQVSAR